MNPGDGCVGPDLDDAGTPRREAAVTADPMAGQVGPAGAAGAAGPAARAGSDRSDRSDSPEPEEAWYVYAIVRRAECDGLGSDELTGIENRPVRLVRGGELAAVSAQVPLAGFRRAGQEPSTTEGSWLAGAVRSHDLVVSQVFGLATVLPLRFGALYPGAADVAGVLRTHGPALHAELLRLRGMAEWGVTAELTRTDNAEHPVPTHAGGGRPTAEPPSHLDEPDAGTAWMRRQQSAARARSRARADSERMAGEIHEVMRRHARDSVAQGRAPGGGAGLRVLDRSYLVERHRADRFRLELGALSDRFGQDGLRLRVTGPWPPYHFVRLPERIGHG